MHHRCDRKAVLHRMVIYGARRENRAGVNVHRPEFQKHETGLFRRKSVRITHSVDLNLAFRIRRHITRSGDWDELALAVAAVSRELGAAGERSWLHFMRFVLVHDSKDTAAAPKPKLLLEDREAAHAKSEKLKLTSRTSLVKYGF